MIGSVQSSGLITDSGLRQTGEVMSEKIRIASHDEERLYRACLDFEAVFVKQMLDSMRNTVPKGGLFDGGMSQEIFEDRLYNSYAETISQTASLGLAKQMFEQIKETL